MTARTVPVFSEFDDQDRVLGRYADDRDQSDLEIDVVRIVAKQRGDQYADHAQRYDQNHRERDRPALVQGRKHEEHSQDCKPVDDHRL